MKPFNLDEYLKKPTRKVVIRDGDNARIICTDARGDYPVIALVEKPHEARDIIYSYTKGGYFYVTGKPSPFDLFFAPEKHKGWINVYRDTDIEITSFGAELFASQEEAEEVGKPDDCYVATAKIEWEE